MPINWVDVPDPKNPPAGAPKLEAANLNKLAVIADIGVAGTPTGNAGRAAFVAHGDLVLNVKDYGAKGDGVTDDTAAINAAVTAASGRTLFFPDGGTYLTTTGLSLPATTPVRLVGGNGATIKATALMAGLVTKPAGACSDIVIRDLNLDGNVLADRCLDIEQAHRLHIEGGTFQNAKVAVADFGRSGGQVYEMTWRRSRVVGRDDNASGAAPSQMPTYGYLFGANVTDNVIEQVVVKNAQTCVRDAGASNLHLSVHVFGYPFKTSTNATEWTGPLGFDLAGDNVRLLSPYCDTQNIGVQISGTNCQVHTGQFFWQGTWLPAADVVGVSVISGGNYNSIIGNTFAIPASAGFAGWPVKTASGSFNTLFFANMISGTPFRGPYSFSSAGGTDIAQANIWSGAVGNDTTPSSSTFGGFAAINGAAATSRELRLTTAGSTRWRLRADATAETGSQSGSLLQLHCYNDDGSIGFQFFDATRNTGLVNWYRSMVRAYASQNLNASGALTFNAAAANTQVAFLAANLTSSTITNPTNGMELTIAFVQDGTGGRTYVWPTTCKFAGGVAPSDTTANSRTSVTFVYSGTAWQEIGRAVGVR